MPMRSWVCRFAGAALLSACQRSPVAQAPQPASVPPLGLVPLSQIDLGATLLAEVANARVAIALRDPVAASNDVAQALSFAMQLPDRPSNLIRAVPISNDRDRTSGPRAMRHYEPPLTVFAVQVELGSVQAQLPGNLNAADTQLRDIQNGIPQGSIPADLALLKAAASLDLAQIAAAEGRRRNLRTQLLSAQIALGTFSGPRHTGEAIALQATIDQSLRTGTVNTMLSYQPSSWLSKVLEWDGAYSWNAPIR
jgi:hypothetical protein